MFCGCPAITYIIRISTVFALGFRDVYTGSLIWVVFWSTTACIRASHYPQERVSSLVSPSISFFRPHTNPSSICLYLSLFLYHLVLSCLPCGSNSLYFCYALRTPSLSLSVALHTNLFHKPVLSSIYCPFVSLVFFFLFTFTRSHGKFCPSWSFTRSPTHLI